MNGSRLVCMCVVATIPTTSECAKLIILCGTHKTSINEKDLNTGANRHNTTNVYIHLYTVLAILHQKFTHCYTKNVYFCNLKHLDT